MTGFMSNWKATLFMCTALLTGLLIVSLLRSLATRSDTTQTEVSFTSPPISLPTSIPRVVEPENEIIPPSKPLPVVVTKTRKVLKWVLYKSIWNEVSTYTSQSDGGSWDRTTAALRFRNTPGYPTQYCTLRYAIENKQPICAVPSKFDYVHKGLIKYSDGHVFHGYRVRFPWYDPPGHLRYPIDRVPYSKDGVLLPQRDRFDMFMFMPDKQALKHGRPLMPVEIYKAVWVDEPVKGKQ